MNMGPTKQSINVKKLNNIQDAHKNFKDNNRKSSASPQFYSFYDELDEVLGTCDAIKTSVPTDLFSFVNSSKRNLCSEDEKSKETNQNGKHRKHSANNENTEGFMVMNMRMSVDSEERHQKFLGHLFKQHQETHRHERMKDMEFILKLSQMFTNDK